jgi:aminotransferase
MLDPAREVAIVPGSKTALMEFALVAVERGETILLPDPGYADYPSAVALASARRDSFTGDFESARGAALYLNYPSNPTAACVPNGFFDEAVRWAMRNGSWILHDFAYGDLVFDGRAPESFLAADGARDVGVELFSMSKSYGMAGWRLGFVVGNAELVSRVERLQDHLFAGIFRPVQEAGIAALTGPQSSVEDRRKMYERRRDRALEALLGVDAQSDGTFFVWFRLPHGMTAERLLVEHRLVVAPGEGFGPNGEGYARLSLAVTDETLDAGLARLAVALADYEVARPS